MYDDNKAPLATDADRRRALAVAGFNERWTYEQARHVSEPDDMRLVDRIAAELAAERARTQAHATAPAELPR